MRPWNLIKVILILLIVKCSANPLRKNIPFVPRQEVFAVNVAKLILFINANGYQVTLGETIRTQAQANIYAKKGIGIRDSFSSYCKLFRNNYWKSYCNYFRF